MGNVKYPWWFYVQSMIRNYPARKRRRYENLNRVEKLEFDAVKAARARTRQKEDGRERLELVRRVYWSREKKTISGIAADLYISRATAFRWGAEFILTVAECFGIYDPE